MTPSSVTLEEGGNSFRVRVIFYHDGFEQNILNIQNSLVMLTSSHLGFREGLSAFHHQKKCVSLVDMELPETKFYVMSFSISPRGLTIELLQQVHNGPKLSHLLTM